MLGLFKPNWLLPAKLSRPVLKFSQSKRFEFREFCGSQVLMHQILSEDRSVKKDNPLLGNNCMYRGSDVQKTSEETSVIRGLSLACPEYMAFPPCWAQTFSFHLLPYVNPRENLSDLYFKATFSELFLSFMVTNLHIFVFENASYQEKFHEH